MIDRLLPTQRRMLALGILAVVVALVAAAVWFPLAYLHGQDAALAAG